MGVLGLVRFGRGPYLERIEILGVLDHEKGGLMRYIEQRNIISRDCYAFVDNPGCTCDVSRRKGTPHDFSG